MLSWHANQKILNEMPHGHLRYEDGTPAIHGIPDVAFHTQKRSFLIKNFWWSAVLTLYDGCVRLLVQQQTL